MLTLKYIKHKDIDFIKWDQTVLSSELPLVFAQSFYLNATSPNWDALVIGDYETVFPITKKRKFGINYLPQPSFTSQLGAFGKIENDREWLFYNYIITHYKLIEIELNATNTISTEYITPKKTYFINYNQLYNYNQNTRRNIKKAIDNDLKTLLVADQEIITLSEKWINPFLHDEVRLSKNVIKKLNILLLNSLAEENLITFKTVNKNNDLKALAHFIFNGKHALYLKGTNFDKNENSGSMHLLMDTAINYFKNKATIFDFGGGASSGLASFYQGFGGSPLLYGFLKFNALPKLITTLKRNKS